MGCMLKLKKSTYWLKLSEFVSKNSWIFRPSFMYSNNNVNNSFKCLKIKTKMPISWLKHLFLTSWWTMNGRFHVAVGIVWEVTFLILRVNGMHVSRGRGRGKRSTVIRSLHQFWIAALPLKILWSDSGTSFGCLSKWNDYFFCSTIKRECRVI